jgi:NAD dependent epimerase/dehydratase family enzyme
MSRPSIAAVPSFALRLALGEMADLVLHGQRTTADKLLATGYQFQVPQAEAALQNLLTTGS